MKQILLVDDHRTFLAGTAVILEKHGFGVTTASRGTDALEQMNKARFDLFVFDLKLHGMNGFELAEATLQRYPEALIVILTGEDIAEHYDRLIEIGVTGLVEKSLGESEFIGCLQLALQQLTVLPVHIARQLRSKQSQSLERVSESNGTSRTLSDREIEVLKLIAQGHKNKDIADRLFTSQRNVEYMISRLFEKLGASSRQEAVMKGIERKWLNLNL